MGTESESRIAGLPLGYDGTEKGQRWSPYTVSDVEQHAPTALPPVRPLDTADAEQLREAIASGRPVPAPLALRLWRYAQRLEQHLAG